MVVDNVLRVASQGIDRSDPDLVLSILSVGFEPGEEENSCVPCRPGLFKKEVGFGPCEPCPSPLTTLSAPAGRPCCLTGWTLLQTTWRWIWG